MGLSIYNGVSHGRNPGSFDRNQLFNSVRPVGWFHGTPASLFIRCSLRRTFKWRLKQSAKWRDTQRAPDLFISSHLDRVQPGSTARLIVWKPLPEPGLHLDHLELKISQDNSSSQVHENTHYRTSIAEDCRIRTEHLRMTSFGLPKTWLLLHHIRLLLHSFQHCKFAGLSCIHAEVSGICLASKWLASLTYTLMKDIHSWNLTISKQFWLQESSWILPCQSCSSNGLTRCANGTTMPFQSRSTAKWLGLMLGSLQ